MAEPSGAELGTARVGFADAVAMRLEDGHDGPIARRANWVVHVDHVTDRMFERRASDKLWRELREAVVAAVHEHHTRTRDRIDIDQSAPFVLGLQRGQGRLELRGSREMVTGAIWSATDPNSRLQIAVGLRPGTLPPLRLDGHAESAKRIARKLLAAFLEHDS